MDRCRMVMVMQMVMKTASRPPMAPKMMEWYGRPGCVSFSLAFRTASSTTSRSVSMFIAAERRGHLVINIGLHSNGALQEHGQWSNSRSLAGASLRPGSVLIPGRAGGSHTSSRSEGQLARPLQRSCFSTHKDIPQSSWFARHGAEKKISVFVRKPSLDQRTSVCLQWATLSLRYDCIFSPSFGFSLSSSSFCWGPIQIFL